MDNLVAGYFAACLVGMTLGFFGGGGTILTLPVLVYIMGVEPVLATAYSLFVIGLTSSLATIGQLRRKLVDFPALLAFGIPSLCAVYLTRMFLVPNIPETIFSLGDFTLTRDTMIMVTFVVIMTIAAIAMIRPQAMSDPLGDPAPKGRGVGVAIAEGLVVGTVTGLVGAGGGFLIVPMLVVRWQLPIRTAIGTSLAIIAVKSLCGFAGDLAQSRTIEWLPLLGFMAIATVGMMAGVRLNQRAKIDTLKTGFGWFVLVMAAAIAFKELSS